jgi:glycosyltransferase involved in cell wall biosynthesis
VLCYRAGHSILNVAEPLYELLRREQVPFELVLVANYWPAQRDDTPAVVAEFAEGREGVRVLAEPKAGAMGWDMRRGLAAARGNYLVVMDGDAQNPVDDAIRIFHEIRALDVDVLKGRRVARHDGLYRRLVSTVYNLLFAAMFGTRGLWDINGKPKALTRAAYESMDLASDDWFIDAEIVLAARARGLRIAEMPVIFHENKERSSFVRVGAIFEFLRNMVDYRVHRI